MSHSEHTSEYLGTRRRPGRRGFAAKPFLLGAFLIVLTTAGWTLHDPGDGAPLVPNPGFELTGYARLFYDLGDLDAMLHYLGRYDTDRSAMMNSAMIGGYYRIHDNVKVGAFYKLAVGERHDEDWIESGSSWIWRDTSGRLEHTFHADVTPRFLLEFMPGRDWVLSIKNRYGITLFEEGGELVTLQTLLVRPGLTWFWVRDREPVLNVSVQYGVYASLDFGDTWWYRHGPYAQLIYHLAPDLMLGVDAGTNWIYWTESADFDRVWPNNGYTINVWRPWTIGVGVIYRLRG